MSRLGRVVAVDRCVHDCDCGYGCEMTSYTTVYYWLVPIVMGTNWNRPQERGRGYIVSATQSINDEVASTVLSVLWLSSVAGKELQNSTSNQGGPGSQNQQAGL